MPPVPYADIPFSARLAWGAQDLTRWSRQMALACAKAGAPLTDAVFDLAPQGKASEEAYLRASDPAWWRRNGARKLRIAQEVQELRRGVIGSTAQKQYAGVKAEEWAAHTKKATHDFLKHSVVYDPGGAGPVPLAKVFKTPAMLAARYYAFLKGIEQLADERQLRWGMLTITLPPEWHPNPQTKLKRSKKAHQWNQRTADQANREIGAGWHRVRMALRKHGIHMTGLRTEEPMKDTTPHWHCAFYFRGEEDLQRVCTAVLQQFPAGLRIRHGLPTPQGKLRFEALQYQTLGDWRAGKSHKNFKKGAQCQIDVGANKTGDPVLDKQISSFASYVLKYVAKHCGVKLKGSREEVIDDTTSIIESGPAAKVKQHRQTYGIRGIEFYGIPKGVATCWDVLRQVNLKDEDFPPPPHVKLLAAICQADKGQGFAQYLRLLGGLAICPVTPVYAVKLVKTETLTRYRSKGCRMVGVEVLELATACRQVHLIKTGQHAIMRDVAAQALGETAARGGFNVLEVVLDAKSAAEGGLVQIGIVETLTDEAAEAVALEASNTSQQQAITAQIDANYTVLAAAGSGKTHVLIERVRFLISSGIDAASIVLATFTREAANNMQARLQALGVNDVQVGTMHALAYAWTPWSCRPSIEVGESFERIIEISSQRGRQDKYLLIDEAQDLSTDQWKWVQAHARYAFVVGDLRQSIYGWRNAKKDGLMTWAHHTGAAQRDLYKPITLVDLPYNRRSGAAIVALGNAVAGAAAPAIAVKKRGCVCTIKSPDPLAEVEHIAEWLRAAQGSKAVLARTNTEVAFLKAELFLRDLDIPVVTVHEAKGQEWDSVVLACGKRKPSEKSEEAPETFYVAVTRAVSDLLITSQGELPVVLDNALKKLTGVHP